MGTRSKNAILSLFHKTIGKEISDRNASGGKKITRKKFLEDSVKASVMLGVSSSVLSSFTGGKDHSGFKIAIIGGGIAGLHAGHIFNKYGLDFQLFEASNILGGRIYTLRNEFGENLTTELGGEFIDSNHSDMLSLVKEYGLSLYDCEKDVKTNALIKDTYFFDNQHYSEEALINEFSQYAPLIAADVYKVSEEEDETVIQSFDSISIFQYLKGKGMNGWLLQFLSNAYTSEYGLDSDDQSALNLLYMLNPNTKNGFKVFGDSDERFKIVGGNSLLTEKMGEKLSRNIFTNHQLNRISQLNEGYQLEFNNGKKDFYDFVVMAIPFSVLRNITLDISLPESKKKAIFELGYGTSSKIILGVNDRFWRNQGFSGYLFSELIQNGWDSSVGQCNNSGIGSYTVFLGGDSGKVSAAGDFQSFRKSLKNVFTTSESSINEKAIIFNWTEYKYSLGGYSVYRVGQWTSIAGHEKSEVNNLFFAGEHCSQNFQGYMNGGAETGRLAAEAIIRKIKSKTK